MLVLGCAGSRYGTTHEYDISYVLQAPSAEQGEAHDRRPDEFVRMFLGADRRGGHN